MTTRQVITIAALKLSLVLSCYAEEPEKLESLRTAYEEKINQALTLLDDKYVEALERLQAEYTKNGDLEGALATRAEIKKLTQSTSKEAKSELKKGEVKKVSSGSEDSKVVEKMNASNLKSDSHLIPKEIYGTWYNASKNRTLIISEEGIKSGNPVTKKVNQSQFTIEGNIITVSNTDNIWTRRIVLPLETEGLKIQSYEGKTLKAEKHWVRDPK